MFRLLMVSLFIFQLSVLNVSAQEQSTNPPQYGWKKEMIGNLNFTQNNFDNWRQGGENSWSWQTDLNGKFVNDQEAFTWSNAGKLSYGQTKVGDNSARKSADEIKLESVFTYKLNVYVNPFISVTGLTQLTAGYKYSDTSKVKISNFMDPGYFTQSIGFGYQPNQLIKTRIGAAIKETFTTNYSAARTIFEPETLQ